MKNIIYIGIFLLILTSCTKNHKQYEVTRQPVTISQPSILETANTPAVTHFPSIIDDNVNVMLFPSFDAEVVSQLQKNDKIQIRGFSNETDTIDNFSGNWINILSIRNNSEYLEGWVFSKYINIGSIKPAPIKFVEIMPFGFLSEKMRISYTLEENEIFVDVESSSWNGNIFIIWSPNEQGFHYTNIPGIYFLDKETSELKHFSYAGAFNEGGAIAWTSFTSDNKYLIQDSGTSSGIRGITAWRCSDSKMIYQGIYYGSSAIREHTISVVYICDDWHLNRGFTDEEIMLYGYKYKEENSMPDNIADGVNKGLYAELIVKCTINLDTGERQIIGAEYILTQ
jgi:hypothetical protein